MQAGSLDRRVTLLRRSTVEDDFNADAETWSELATVWASFKPVSDVERVQAQAVGAVATARFQIRWSTQVRDLSPKDRLLFEGRTYGVSAVKPLGRRTGLEITASAAIDEAVT